MFGPIEVGGGAAAENAAGDREGMLDLFAPKAADEFAGEGRFPPRAPGTVAAVDRYFMSHLRS